MKFSKGFLFISYFFGFISCSNRKVSLMEDYYKMVGEPLGVLIKIKITDYVKFLKEYYVNDPISCLEEAFWMRDFAFDEIFFQVILSDPIIYTEDPQYIYLPRAHTPIFYLARKSCEHIKSLIVNRLCIPCHSEEDLELNFSVIEIMIKFIKRYINLVDCFRFFSVYRDELNKDVTTWKEVMRYISSHSGNGKLEYNYFFSTFHRFIRPGVREYPIFESASPQKYLLLNVSIHNIVKRKDPEFFEIDHPEFPFLIAIIFNFMNRAGEILYHGYNPSFLYQLFKDYFALANKEASLLKVYRQKKSVKDLAKARLSLKNVCENSSSDILDLFEESFPKPLNPSDHNIWWQLKGLVILEEYIESSKYQKITPMKQNY
jgi:hypothetical protein